MKVLDSSAMLAYLKGEPGSEIVGQIIEEEDQVVAHAVNLCEVFYDYLRTASPKVAEQAIEILKEDGVLEQNDMDGAFWRDVAELITKRRSLPPEPGRPKAAGRLALGDAIGLALARRLGATFVTADRAELTPVSVAALARVQFIG